MSKPGKPGVYDTALIDLADLPAGAQITPADSSRDEWIDTAAVKILTWARTVEDFTAYEAIQATGIQAPPHPNWWGSLFSHLKTLGLEPVGWTHSLRKTSASSGVRRWRARPSVPAESPVS